MAISNPLDILLEHDKWATKQILQACEELSPEQFARKFEIGPGSLQETLTHMMGAMQTWTDSLAGRPIGPRLDQTGVRLSVAQLLPLAETTYSAFAAEARRLPLDHTITRARQGKEHTFTRGVVVTHVATHGMHHLAQCLNMLRHLGVSPLPMSSVAEWSRVVDLQK
jgi:uncharacterized damage-inducible protein DinB